MHFIRRLSGNILKEVNTLIIKRQKEYDEKEDHPPKKEIVVRYAISAGCRLIRRSVQEDRREYRYASGLRSS